MKCEFLTLADAAQVQGDKILILGRGLRCLTTSEGFPFEHHLGVAASLVLRASEAARRYRYTFRISPERAPDEASDVKGEFEASRPYGDQHLLLAANLAPRFARPGPYALQLLVDGGEVARANFTVIDSSLAAAS